ncbi:uncharacterized protein LOC144546233 [Carex rostrata]
MLKKELWIELDAIRASCRDPWIISGDFNVIRNPQEKSGTNFDVSISKRFNQFINRHNLVEQKLTSRKYTWSNGTNFALLDRFLTIINWDQQYPHTSVLDLCKNGSDHCPILLQIEKDIQSNRNSFRIDPLWLEQEDFCALIDKWWKEYPLDPSNLASSWVQKLSFLRRKIRGWARNFYGQKKKTKQSILHRLNSLDTIRETRDLSYIEKEEWQSLHSKLDDIYLEDELYWKHRAKQKWLDEGDQNTKYFHALANNRKKKNRINSLDINNTTTTSPYEIQQHLFASYKDILGITGIKYASLKPQFWADHEKVSLQENSLLVAPFTLDDIKKALFDCEASGTPGPDGFSFQFYQHFWLVVHTDLALLCTHFHDNILQLDKLNKSIICLIPKEANASTINKFRPISLVNCSFKLISKILTHRLGHVMHRIIDDSQAAFLPGRNILDNIVISQELIHYSKHHNQQGIVVKVDFEKAYDKIHWTYLLEILVSRGFHPTWISWIQSWLVSSQSCLTVNDELTPYFYCKRGVRQGDPLSPFLFILAADTLSRIFNKGNQAQTLQGLGPKCFHDRAITNCHYADDTILFLEARDAVIESAWWAMKAFEALSGIKINLSKTEMYGINIDNLSHFAEIFQCSTSQFPIRYLGLPLHDRKLLVSDWHFLIDKFEKKLPNWKGHLLSIGGRHTLLNSVLSATPLYAMSLHKIPYTIIAEIDKIRCRFLWQGTSRSRKKYALVNWRKICLAKEYGGLGILDLRDMNQALLAKWWWKFKDPTYRSHWKTLICHIYQIDTLHTPFSTFWKSVMSLDNLGSCSTQFTPGSSSCVRFWEDIWHDNCALSSQFSQLYAMCTNKNILLSEVIHSQGQQVQFCDILDGVALAEWNHLLAFLSQISFTHIQDKLAWRWDHTGNFTVSSLYKFLNHRGVLTPHPFLWWKLPLPPKIKIFMWLVSQNRILTKSNLRKKGWDGDTTCVFCDNDETANHLFLTCPLAMQIWQLWCPSRSITVGWSTITEIISYAVSLPAHHRTVFLILVSAICWTLWKHRNEICFQNSKVKDARNINYLIISLLYYWTANKRVKKHIQTAAHRWIPEEEILEVEPLRMMFSGDDEVLSNHPTESESTT